MENGGRTVTSTWLSASPERAWIIAVPGGREQIAEGQRLSREWLAAHSPGSN